ncbi:MAG: hypothetical protein LJE85_07850, partial [Gammaproteobacteria bacterium]|nr:hypothetical protein [Gammaproteobacteria bacterium]
MKQAKSPWSWMVRGSRWGALQCRLLFLMSVMAASACSNIDENPPSDDGGQNKVGNNLPDVSAGEDFTPAEYLSEFTLDGNAWDEEDGSTVSVLWSQVSGPDSVTIMAPSQPTTQVKTGVFTQSPGQFTFRLTATDKDGGSSFDDVVVTVPKPQLIISAGDNISVNSGDEVTLHADVGFPDPAVQKTIVWQKVTDTVVTDMSGTTTEDLHFSAPSVSVTTNIRFDVTASVTISDETETVSDTVTVTVNPNPNASPVVNAGGDRSVVSGSSVQITAIASDTDGSIDSYAWSRVSGPSVTLLGSATPTVSFTAPTVSVNDNLTLRLTVTDNDGVDASDDVIITILPVNSNQPPTVTADDDQLVNGGDPVTLSAVATDDGSIAAYLWSDETVNGPAISLSGEQTANVSFTAPQVNQRTVLTLRVTVTDDQGVVASDDVMVTINAPPHADAGADQQAEAGSSVTLTGNGSDTDGNVTTYLWTQTGTPQVPLINADRPSAEFITPDVTQATELRFQLTVTDNDGATASDTVIVTVNPLPPNQPPIALAGEDQAVNPGDVITLSGAGEDSDGSITGYLWAHSPGQNQEPVISLADPQLQTVTFTAPAVSESTTLTFTLTVTDDAGDTGTDTVVVTVHPLATLSGTITSANATLIDSDTNAEGTTPVANNPYEKSQHIPNPVTLGGYVHREGVGPVGSSNNGGAVDAEDVYHVNLAPGQVVTIYLGESYSTSDTQPTIEAWLTNDYTSAADYVRYDYEPRSSSGAIILTAPVANSIPPPPADGHYLINILAGDNSAYSYVLTVGSAASAQSNGWSAQQDFVPYELIVDFKESEQSGPLNSKQSQVSLAQRAASVGMEALGGAPGRSMLLGFADPSAKASAFATLGIQNRIQPA